LSARHSSRLAGRTPFDDRRNQRSSCRSIHWLILGSVLACVVALTFVLAFGLRWAPNLQWNGTNAALILWAIGRCGIKRPGLRSAMIRDMLL
jgi:sterol desaturase/sphingolipid hydroxylase (fatty acid hydroxylase superfamily)